MARYLPYRWGGRRVDRNLLFHLWGHVPGVHTLSPFLAINSQTVEPFFRYKGGDASLSGWPAWEYGPDLSFVNVGTDPIFNVKGPGLGSFDDGVFFKYADYYYDSFNSVDISSEDFVFEWIQATDVTGFTNGVFGTYDAVLKLGFYARTYDDTYLGFSIGDSSNNKHLIYSPIITGAYYHCMVFGRRAEDSDNGFVFYVNGIIVDSENISTIGSISRAPFWLGKVSNYAYCNLPVYLVSGWKLADWLPAGAAGPTEYAVIAAERFHRWSGMWPTKAVGTWAPTVATRAFGAYLENQDQASPYTKRIYQVGSEHLRVQRAMVGGTRLIGYRPEPQATNLIPESEDLATTWTATRCTISQDEIDTPDGDGRTVVDGIVASVDADTHYVEITPPFNDGVAHWVSFNAKKGAVDFVKVEFMTTGSYAYFDLDSKTVETTSGLNAYIDGTIADDFCKCIIKDTLAAADAMRLYPAEADGDETFAGDGSTSSIYVWGVQAESGVDYVTSTINTDAATATRLADQARYKGDDGNIPIGSGKITMKVLFPLATQLSVAAFVPFVFLSDGGSMADYIGIYFMAAEGEFVVVSSAASGGAGGQSLIGNDIRDGAIHNIEVRWKTNYLAIAVDGVWATADTTVDIPDDLDRIDVGRFADDSYFASDIVISDLKIMKWQ